ncbi:hypothetical protein OK074_8897 [Actinobacteria bacterium OK074]|nr:hypothetical protein OK074_8897 [Actinobacteria bacterium OK074]
MTSKTTTTTEHTPDDTTQLVTGIREFAGQPLPLWEPPGGWADPTTVDLHAVQAGLRRLIS